MSMFSKIKEINDLRSQAKELENALSQLSITQTSSDESVRVTMTAKMEVTELTIAPETSAEIIKETINAAIIAAQRKAAEHMRTSGGLNFPGLS
ncbi:MAG: hypothetical protein COT25_02000 [Candidatus Kerfeldbacteria bacterium CG08_land_8_20_14_0_20_42_7]|uniref:Nucleoid-associated protein n=1 Tax=Candidatus Kerfeldbacteria bacterium CG08_land_8_20_14_0_20_42_7 TaxID=2014245 RepID=A0A2H0YTQ3_9BACT|nr:MAG: hypothetical protein COT25_02000 [Candidatus Kerfeldbacteria bacterium CG08_land_8_20_14_0_20_42_7]